MDALQSRGMSLDRAGDGKCTLRALSRPPAPRDVLLRERPGVWPSMRPPDSRCEDIRSRGDTGKAAQEDASPPSTAKVAPGW
jgi:hypothetical protein